jgi:hypothetical protein
LARKQKDAAEKDSAEQKSAGGLDVATVAPWVLFWGWVALDSALAYRKSQAALEQASEAEEPQPPEVPPEPRLRRWLRSAPVSVDGLQVVRKRSRVAMIGAPVIAVLGPLVLGKLLRRRKP